MRKLMWFTIGYTLSCALGTWLLRGNGILLIPLVCGLLSLGLLKFRQVPVVRRGLVLMLGIAGWMDTHGM